MTTMAKSKTVIHSSWIVSPLVKLSNTQSNSFVVASVCSLKASAQAAQSSASSETVLEGLLLGLWHPFVQKHFITGTFVSASGCVSMPNAVKASKKQMKFACTPWIFDGHVCMCSQFYLCTEWTYKCEKAIKQGALDDCSTSVMSRVSHSDISAPHFLIWPICHSDSIKLHQEENKTLQGLLTLCCG